MNAVVRRGAVVAGAGLLLVASACRAGPSAPSPVPAPSSPPPVQRLEFERGEASVRVTGAVRASFRVPLAPSSAYPSPPADLVLSWGDPRTGEGLDLQGPEATGTSPTSDAEVLVISLRVGGRDIQAGSLDGECTVSLTSAALGDVRGSFRCHGLAIGLVGGSTIDATGTFTASGCRPAVACRSAGGSE